MSFEPLSLEFLKATQEVKVTGHSMVSSGSQRLSGQKTFIFRFDLIRYRPVLAALKVYTEYD